MSSGPLFDVAVLWELLHDEGGRYEPTELAELAVGDARPEAVASVVEALKVDRVHFRERKGAFEPRPAASVEESLRQRRLAEERERRQAETVAAVRAAIASGGPLPAEDHEEVLRPVLELAVFGDQAPKRQAAQDLLEACDWRRKGPAALSAFRLLVRLGWLDEDENLLLRRHGVTGRFPAAALAEADAVAAGPAPEDDPARIDRTGVLTLAIDDAETSEVDDALSATLMPGGGTRVEVHIADAAAFVPAEGEIEREAGRRGATLYLPDRTWPMLPPVLSRDRASLGGGLVRPAITFRIDLDAAGNVVDFEPAESKVCVDRRLTYEEADALLAGDSAESQLLRRLRELALRGLQRRCDAGAITVQPPEVKVRVDEAGEVEIVPIHRASPARALVAEWMITTGHLCARWLESAGIPAVYRCQEPPDVSVPSGGDTTATEVDAVLFYALVRQLRRAVIGTRPGLHAGLGVHPYVQVTSPLRRFSDLKLHRQIKGWLRTGAAPADEAALIAAVGPAEEAVVALSKIERETDRYFVLKHLATRVGEELTGVVLAERERGRWLVELDNLAFQAVVSFAKRRSPGDVVTLRVAAARPREDRLTLHEVAPTVGQPGPDRESER